MSATNSRAPTARAGRSTSACCAPAASDDAVLEARQWESDHFEDVPVHVVACVYGPPARSSRPIGAAAFYASAFPAVQNLLLAAGARGLGASATTLPLWSAWEARRTWLPRRVTPVAVVALGWPRGGTADPVPDPPVGNIVHLDRLGHQPFRARPRPARPDTA